VDRNRVAFILTELQLAMVYLKAANSAACPGSRAQNLADARRAHEIALDVFTSMSCSDQERGDIEAGLAAIKKGLDAG
jgi:hypothetical protein